MHPTRLPIRLLAILALAACSADAPLPVGPADAPSAARKPGGGGTSKQTTYSVRMEGDVTMPLAGAPAPTVTRNTANPFGKSDLTVTGVGFAFAAAPTGSVAVCQARSGFTFSSQWTAQAGQWHGDVTVKGGTGTLNFRGSRGDPLQALQSSTAPTGDASPDAAGVWRWSYADATQFFGGTTTGFDGLYRCMNVTIVLTPVT